MRIFRAILLIFLITYGVINSQNSLPKAWNVKFENSNSYIENKGQFKINQVSEPLLFRFGNEQNSIFFTKSGLVYTFLKHNREVERDEKEKFETIEEYKKHEEKEHKLNFSSDLIQLIWKNSNPNVQVLASEEATDYNSFSYYENKQLINVNYVKSYRKLIYKNLYAGIDVEYLIHPVDGIKYNIIVYPGADLSQLVFEYTGNSKIKSNGDLLIKTAFGDIREHAPISFYLGNSSEKINSSFQKKGKNIFFQIDNYDRNRTVIIDPWVQLPTFGVTTWNCVWECEKDGTGNVYALGGGASQSANSQMQVKKYNQVGVLQWTYNTPYDTSNCWLGTFATDNAGNSYVTRGSVSGMQKIDANGSLIWNNNGGGGSIGNSDEYWNISFNCDQTKLIVGGTTGAFALPPVLEAAIFEINVNNGNIISVQKVAKGPTISIPPNTQEVRSLTPSPAGKYYYLTQDTIGYLNQNSGTCPSGSSGSLKINNGIDLGYKCEDYRFDNSGIMALRADSNFLYVNRGSQIQKRNLQTLAVVATANIPGGAFNNVFLGGNTVSNSGIDVDQCGNIYVGSKNQVIKFDANLNVLATYTTSYNVYDVHVLSSGDIVACGSTGTSSSTGARTGYVQVISSGACSPLALTCCNAGICIPSSFCQNDPSVNLTAITSGGIWSGTGITNANNGTFDPALAGPGVHNVTYTLPCGSESVSLTVLGCQALNVCAESNGDITVSGSGTFTWYQQTTTQSCASCIIGCVFPPGCAVNVTSWTSFGTGSTITPPSNYPLYVINNNGDSAFIPSFSSLPACANLPCPAISVTSSNVSDVLCFGQANGSATVSASGGSGNYTYNWMPGNLAGASLTNLASGNYTVTALDTAGCSGTTVITINQPTSSVSIVTNSIPSTCGNNDGTVSANASGGTGILNYSWQPGGQTGTTVGNIGAGTYTVTVTDQNNCSASSTVVVTSTNPPVVTAVANGPFCEGGAINLNASGGVTFSWTGPNGFTSSSQNPVIFPASTIQSGAYIVTATDANGCVNTASVSVQVTASPTISISTSAPTFTVYTIDNFTLTANGADSYSWFPDGSVGQQLVVNSPSEGVITYCAVGTTTQGCQDSACITFLVLKLDCGSLYIPNAFSPNGDQSNDELCLYGAQCIETLQLKIFDRWGEMVFETANPDFCWDGKYNGKILNPGVFAYYLIATFKNGEKTELKGNINLIK